MTNDRAQLACQPDGTFVSRQTLKSGRIRLVEGEKEGYLELEGTPDMVLEVVSASSVEKDKVTLPDLYWRAGIPEYWVVDARADRLEFDIFRRGSDGYVADAQARRAGSSRASSADLSVSPDTSTTRAILSTPCRPVEHEKKPQGPAAMELKFMESMRRSGEIWKNRPHQYEPPNRSGREILIKSRTIAQERALGRRVRRAKAC